MEVEQKSTIEKYRDKLFNAQRSAVITEGEGQLTEQQVNDRCQELQKQIIDAETGADGFRNPKLAAIWASTRKKSELFY